MKPFQNFHHDELDLTETPISWVTYQPEQGKIGMVVATRPPLFIIFTVEQARSFIREWSVWLQEEEA